MATKKQQQRMLKDIKSEIERYIRQCEDTISLAMHYVAATGYDYLFCWHAAEVFINTKSIEYFKAMLEECDFENAEPNKRQNYLLRNGNPEHSSA